LWLGANYATIDWFVQTRFQKQLLAQRGRFENELAPATADSSGENKPAIWQMAENALEELEGVVDGVKSGFVLVDSPVYLFNAEIEPR
jgi:hypothetical protein